MRRTGGGGGREGAGDSAERQIGSASFKAADKGTPRPPPAPPAPQSPVSRTAVRLVRVGPVPAACFSAPRGAPPSRLGAPAAAALQCRLLPRRRGPRRHIRALRPSNSRLGSRPDARSIAWAGWVGSVPGGWMASVRWPEHTALHTQKKRRSAAPRRRRRCQEREEGPTRPSPTPPLHASAWACARTVRGCELWTVGGVLTVTRKKKERTFDANGE